MSKIQMLCQLCVPFCGCTLVLNTYLTAFVSAYGTTVQAIVRHVNFQQIKCLLLGSPGFVKDDFFEFLNMEAVRREERVRLATAITDVSTVAVYTPDIVEEYRI